VLRGGTTVFAGAGISVSAGLPLGGELVQRYLRALGRNAIGDVRRLQNTLSSESSRLRPEMLFEFVLQQCGPSALAPLVGFLDAKPHMPHLFLAECLRHGNIVVTTNFDTLIEDACEELVVAYRVIGQRREFMKVAAEPVAALGGSIIKLHGTLERGGPFGPDSPLVAALSQVGGGLPPWKSKLLRTVLTNSPIIFVGYSGGDEFDILPVLLGTSARPAMFWCEHRQGAWPPKSIQGHRVDRTHNLGKLTSTRAYGRQIIVDSDMLVNALCRPLGIKTALGFAKPLRSWQTKVMTWAQVDVSKYERSMMLGSALEHAGHAARAAIHYKAAARRAPRSILRSAAYEALGWVQNERLGQYVSAAASFQKALETAP